MSQQKSARVASTHESVIVSQVHGQGETDVLSTQQQEQSRATRRASVKQGVGVTQPVVVHQEAGELAKTMQPAETVRGVRSATAHESLQVSQVESQSLAANLPARPLETAGRASRALDARSELQTTQVVTGYSVEQRTETVSVHKETAAVRKTSAAAKQVASQQVTTVQQTAHKFTSSQVVGLRALLQMAVQESMCVAEVFQQANVQDFGAHPLPVQELARVDTLLRSGVTVDEILVSAVAESLPVLTAPETQMAMVRLVEEQGFRAIATQVVLKEAEKLVARQPIGLKALLRAVDTHTADMSDIVEMATRPREFDLMTPVPEVAQMSAYLNQGVSCQQMLALIRAGELPALSLPETQWPMIQIIEKLGHIATVSQVVAEESTSGESDNSHLT